MPELKVIRREDYAPSPFLVDTVDLTFRLDVALTASGQRLCETTCALALRRNPAAAGGAGVSVDVDLVLHAEALSMVSVKLNGALLTAGLEYAYDTTAETLTVFARHLPPGPAPFVLVSGNTCEPEANLQLQGLFCSSGVFCTQCEAEGFRRITPSLDRPDVLSRYTVRIEAPEAACPVLLSNGNCVASGQLEDAGRHFAVFVDPHPKPTYLFALVAGRLWSKQAAFTTASGRPVKIEVFVDGSSAKLAEVDHAIASVQLAMQWDEEQFGREYDLDIFNVVAVNDFNMGAMENKGLNVFNAKCVLACHRTASDATLRRIQGIVAHEYFHNWTGNRVTCRDWFQLTLKEGLTVFRDQRFSADQGDATVKRIQDVAAVRCMQWPEDQGPMAHAVRPEAYVKMDNFYTRTVYRKGAEVVRLYGTLLGREGFRRGMDLYFQRHDGQAVTCDDFRAAMADAQISDAQGNAQAEAAVAVVRSDAFGRWYSQAGTPTLTVVAAGLLSFNFTAPDGAKYKVFRLVLAQATAPTPGQPHKFPLLLPVATGLVRPGGRAPLTVALLRHQALAPDGEPLLDASRPKGKRPSPAPEAFQETVVLHFDSARAEFLLAVQGLSDDESADAAAEEAAPVLSLLRGWSAPVALAFPSQTAADLSTLMQGDPDGFARFEASHRFATNTLKALAAAHRSAAAAASPDGAAAAAAEAAATVVAVETGAYALVGGAWVYRSAHAVAAAADAAAALVAADDLVAAYVLAWGGVLGAAADFARRGEQHLQALMLTLPSDVEVLNGYAADECLDAAAVAAAKRTLLGALAQSVGADALSAAYRTARLDPSAPYALTPDAEGRRALSLVLLDLWLRADEASGSIGESPREGGSALAALVAHCEEAQNLTDRAGALRLLANVEEEAPRVKALAAYDAEFGSHREAIDEWFTAQALSALPHPAPRLLVLMQHPAFSLANPNKVRAVFGGLATGAPAVLQDPQVLSLLGDVVALVDATNGNLAASLAKMLAQWRRWPAGAAQDGAKAVLERVRDRPGCSKNAEEVAALALQ